MKTIFRYALILLAACLIAYGMYWFVQNNSAALGLNTAGFRDRGGFPGGDVDSAAFQARPSGDFAGRGHDMEHDQVSLIPGLLGIARNLGIIGGITLVVVLLQSVVRTLLSRRRFQPAA